jgi:hypothetical protein
MAGDIFGRAPSPHKGSFSADNSFLQFFGQQGAGMIVQNMSVNYSQSVEVIFEVGSNYRYYVVGRPQGQMGTSRVVGPSNVVLAILTKLGNPCDIGDRSTTLTLGNSGCSSNTQGGQLSYKMSDCLAENYGFSTQAERFVVQDQVGIRFGMLETFTNNANGARAA